MTIMIINMSDEYFPEYTRDMTMKITWILNIESIVTISIWIGVDIYQGYSNDEVLVHNNRF